MNLWRSLAYPVALVTGLGVLSISSPILSLYGLSLSHLTGWMTALPFAVAASVPPYLCALVVMERGRLKGQGAQIVLGASVALIATGLLMLCVGGMSGLKHLLGFRQVMGTLLAGAVAGYVHHGVSKLAPMRRGC